MGLFGPSGSNLPLGFLARVICYGVQSLQKCLFQLGGVNSLAGVIWYEVHVENSGLDMKDGLIDSPNAPLEQAYLSYKWAANAGEGWESNWAAKFQHRQIPTCGPNFNSSTIAEHKSPFRI